MLHSCVVMGLIPEIDEYIKKDYAIKMKDVVREREDTKGVVSERFIIEMLASDGGVTRIRAWVRLEEQTSFVEYSICVEDEEKKRVESHITAIDENYCLVERLEECAREKRICPSIAYRGQGNEIIGFGLCYFLYPKGTYVKDLTGNPKYERYLHSRSRYRGEARLLKGISPSEESSATE